jgi:hypothetical protein
LRDHSAINLRDRAQRGVIGQILVAGAQAIDALTLKA